MGAEMRPSCTKPSALRAMTSTALRSGERRNAHVKGAGTACTTMSDRPDWPQVLTTRGRATQT